MARVEGRPSLSSVVHGALQESESIICLWLVGECDPATDGATCGHLASRRVTEVERFLVEQGADPNLLCPYPSGRIHPICGFEACRVSLRRVFLLLPADAIAEESLNSRRSRGR